MSGRWEGKGRGQAEGYGWGGAGMGGGLEDSRFSGELERSNRT